jgi:hypothetical protein
MSETAVHPDLSWGMAFDLDPLMVIEQRKRFNTRAIAEDWLVFFPHDHHLPFCRVMPDERGRPTVRHDQAAPGA